MEAHGLSVSLPVLHWQLWGWRQSETPWFGFAIWSNPTIGKYYCHGPALRAGCLLNPSCAVSCSPRKGCCVGIPCPLPLLSGSWKQCNVAGPLVLLNTTVCTPVCPHTGASTHQYVHTLVCPHTGTSAHQDVCGPASVTHRPAVPGTPQADPREPPCKSRAVWEPSGGGQRSVSRSSSLGGGRDRLMPAAAPRHRSL